jgi:hypothetical protein
VNSVGYRLGKHGGAYVSYAYRTRTDVNGGPVVYDAMRTIGCALRDKCISYLNGSNHDRVFEYLFLLEKVDVVRPIGEPRSDVVDLSSIVLGF